MAIDGTVGDAGANDARLPPEAGSADSTSPADALADAPGTDGDAASTDRDAPEDAPLCPNDVCPVAIASGLLHTFNLAVDDASVFFTFTGTDGGGGVASVPLEGGAPVMMIAAGETAYGVAVDDTNVYFTNFESVIDGVMKVPLAGGSAVVLAPFGEYPRNVAIGGASLFFTNGLGNTNCGVVSLPKAGDAGPMPFASSPDPWGIALDATNVYWTDGGDGGATGSVLSAPRSGGTPVVLAGEQDGPGAIAVDATSVYWATVSAIVRASLDGGDPSTIASGQANPHAIAIDDAYVYWVNQGSGNSDGNVVKAPLTGGAPPTTLAGAQPTPWDIAVDGTSVYWTSGGRVMKLTPK
jgi:hypothetical protein